MELPHSNFCHEFHGFSHEDITEVALAAVIILLQQQPMYSARSPCRSRLIFEMMTCFRIDQFLASAFTGLVCYSASDRHN